MLTSIFDLKQDPLMLNRLGIPGHLRDSLGIQCDDEDSKQRFMDLLLSVRTGAGDYNIKDLVDEKLRIQIGEETYYIYQRPSDVSEEDWKEFCEIICEAGYVMETPDYNVTPRKQIVAIDHIMFEAITRYAGESYLSFNDRTSRGVWVNSIDGKNKILLGGYYTGLHTYEVASEFEEYNRKRTAEPTNKSSVIFKVLGTFRKLGLDNFNEIDNMVNDVNDLSVKNMAKIVDLAFETERNSRLLTRISTLHEINEIYKLFV